MARQVDVKFEVNWGSSDWTSPYGWIDETVNLISASGAQEVTPPGDAYLGGRQIIQEMSVTLANPDLRYSAYNTAGPLHSHLQAGGAYMKPCRMSVRTAAGGAWEPIFVGFIKTPEEQFSGNRVTIRAWDLGERIRKKQTTVMLTDRTDHDVVKHYLELAGLVDGYDFVAAGQPGATLDYSTVPVDYVWLDDESIWDDLVDLAQASGARIYIGRNGLVRYEKDYRWAMPYSYTPETITLSTLSDFRPLYSDRGFYDEIVIEYAARAPGNTEQELWSASRPRVVASGQTDEFTARFTRPAVSVNAPALDEDYYVRRLAGGIPQGSYTIQVTPFGQQARVVVQNSGAEPIVLMQFKLTGRPLEGQPAEQVKRAATVPVHGRRLELRGNVYIQTELQANAIADFLYWWFRAAKMTFTVSVPGDPTREIGKRIRVQINHKGVYVFNQVGIVIKNAWQITTLKSQALAFTQDLTLMQDVFQPTPGYFVIGDAGSTLGGGRRVWH